MRTALLLSGSVLALSLTGLAPAAASTAAGTPSPSTLTNEATKSFTLSGDAVAASGESVKLTLAGHPDIVGTVTNPDAGPLCGVLGQGCGTSITVSIPANAYPGVYDIVRTQTHYDGSVTGPATTSPGITIKSQPAITSISPATRGQNSSSLVTITGNGFGPNPVVSFGGDITVSDVTYVSGTSLTANVAVPPAATLGTRDLTVTSADGLSGSKPAALTVAPKPTLTSISVPTIRRGVETDGVTFTGSNLVTGGDFAIVINGVDVLNPVASNGGTTVTANLKASDTATGGNRAITLINADGGRAILAGAFRVIAPPSAPGAVAAVPGDTKATVAWTVPTDPGSSPITKYVVTPSGGGAPVEVAGNLTSTVVSGLTNGTAYTFDVQAKNDDAGLGDKKTTSAVTPKYGVTLTAVSNRATAVSGQSAVVYGYLKRTAGTPLAGATVSLRIAQAGASQSTRQLATGSNGRWSTSVVLTYNTSFFATYAGSPSTQARNASVSVPVGTRITVTTPSSGATVRSPFTVRGTVSPNKAGKSVGVYKVTSAGQTLVAKATISSSGTYGAVVRLPVGNYLLKVVLGPVSGNSTGSSPQFVVKRR